MVAANAVDAPLPSVPGGLIGRSAVDDARIRDVERLPMTPLYMQGRTVQGVGSINHE